MWYGPSRSVGMSWQLYTELLSSRDEYSGRQCIYITAFELTSSNGSLPWPNRPVILNQMSCDACLIELVFTYITVLWFTWNGNNVHVQIISYASKIKGYHMNGWPTSALNTCLFLWYILRYKFQTHIWYDLLYIPWKPNH